MIIREEINKKYCCEYCNNYEFTANLILQHEKECPENPNSYKYIKEETKKTISILLPLVYNKIKLNTSILKMLLINNDEFNQLIKDVVMMKINTIINEIVVQEEFKKSSIIPMNKRRKIYEVVSTKVFKKLKKYINARSKSNILYILVDEKDYFSDCKAEMIICKSKQDAFIKLFGSPKDYEDENGNFPFSGSKINWNKYFKTELKDYVVGDGMPIKHIFKLDLETKIATLII